MRNIVAGLFMSLDGVVEAPHRWTGPYWSDEISQGMETGLKDADAILIGKATYVEFTEWWGPRGDSSPMSAFLNNTHKYVVSSSLTEAELKWPEATLISDDFVARITELKSGPGKNIQVPGSPRLVRWLLEQGLLDRLALNVAPIVVGEGRHLFDEVGKQIPLNLTASYALPHGVLGMDFGPVTD
jgi:dihydrofolate reductase